jgi:hypothetical protein
MIWDVMRTSHEADVPDIHVTFGNNTTDNVEQDPTIALIYHNNASTTPVTQGCCVPFRQEGNQSSYEFVTFGNNTTDNVEQDPTIALIYHNNASTTPVTQGCCVPFRQEGNQSSYEFVEMNSHLCETLQYPLLFTDLTQGWTDDPKPLTEPYANDGTRHSLTLH